MLGLALGSVGLLLWETFGDLNREQTLLVIRLDLAIVAVFAVEFTLRWVKDDRPKTFPFRYWYDLLGMIPVSHPVFRGFRLLRLVRVAVILSRFGRAADRAFGEEFTYRLVRRFKAIIVDTISGAVTVRVLDETASVLEKGTYTHNLADALEQRGDEVLEIIVEKVGDDPRVGRIRHMPFFDDIVATSSRVTQRILIDLLRDPRMDVLVRDIIRDNVAQIKASVAARDAARERGETVAS